MTGLRNAEETVEGWGLGDTTARAQIGWTSGTWSNTFYLTSWFPTGRYERGFEPNTGKNHYGVNLGWGVTYTEPNTKLEFDSAIGVTFNATNPATDYKNGDDFIWDWAIGKKFARRPSNFDRLSPKISVKAPPAVNEKARAPRVLTKQKRPGQAGPEAFVHSSALKAL